MTLAIFDLDNTLIAGDSDHLWGEFLCDRARRRRQLRAAKRPLLRRLPARRARHRTPTCGFVLRPWRGRIASPISSRCSEAFMARSASSPIMLPGGRRRC
jgi:phosphoserine phosphatase